ncbi:Ser-Thr-rich glycosyl-phosphatidyl-inositol-anchored membrane family-domain-containing protein [Halteromyces radiatus]|uniref:Ser-Thr-rich glycosyl-phosphatidyl-inositol-anchored membrane family-domain-containing protein n=1 Tax=Halteromyces radiatus TaxID=101107 RepID=UPI0022204C0F|nr:Ser-Thr-rich glycosyl-phosphatidyl-inositol-anchored membrane family-domain-containing protein [Halteromyces radiatus]KAI8085139.1 Ser-Thr-rich glycosyl-phosphatidyl-inositol-anchored membrane family-domain-containing protein [Halteromyces radiatus]
MVSSLSYGLMLMGMMTMMVNANMSPSNPEPGTVWTVGKEYEITWEEDNTEPPMNATWKTFRIDLMTGEDNDQVLLTTIAENVKGNAMTYKYTAPDVTPHAPIYFLMFTNESGENAWSSRFAIVGQDGKQEVPEKSVQPNGEKIPWGVGKLVAGNVAGAAVSSAADTSSAAATASAKPTSMSSGPRSDSPASAVPSSNAAHKANINSQKNRKSNDASQTMFASSIGAILSIAIILSFF